MRCKGQTRLISLQRPLRFLFWDINEAIHRKASAHHTNISDPPQPLTLQPPIPLNLLQLCKSTSEGQCCAREEAHTAPPESVTAPDRWPRSRRWMSKGVGCAAVHVSLCQERVTAGWLCVLHQKKNNVSTIVQSLVLSSFLIYSNLPVVSEPRCHE